MTLKKFLKLHKNGEAQQCVSIKYNGAYLFEEVAQKKIMKSDAFKEIAAKKVSRFCAISSSDMRSPSSVELTVYIEDQESE